MECDNIDMGDAIIDTRMGDVSIDMRDASIDTEYLVTLALPPEGDPSTEGVGDVPHPTGALQPRGYHAVSLPILLYRVQLIHQVKPRRYEYSS
jgi:hypothetical protein